MTLRNELVSEWNYEKNGELQPGFFTSYSHKKVWWKCHLNHEWNARIADRTNGSGCPYCSGRRATPHETDLLSVNPKLASEWNFEKNGELHPGNFTVHSGKKVWWKCRYGHEWMTTIDKRSNGSGCPYCSGRRVIPHETDLLSVDPELANEWNYEKNGELHPESFSAHSHKKVWWKCRLGHEWKASINNKSKVSKCPFCARRRVINHETDLLSVNPKLASEWNYKKNGEFFPESFSAYSNKKVWWKCHLGHEWDARIYNRSMGKGCPYCAGSRVIPYETDLLSVNPKLASEWNYEKNGELHPESFTANSGKKVWWKCHLGHEWFASIDKRSNGTGCPYCAGIRAVPCETDLLSVNPKLASEWNYEKNGELHPVSFTAYSNKKVWWKCHLGHEWFTSIAKRSSGHGCPCCAGIRVVPHVTDLLSVNPELASEWNYEKNGEVNPESFTAYSNKKVWWKCDEGHEWRAVVASRNKGSGCPYCARQK